MGTNVSKSANEVLNETINKQVTDIYNETRTDKTKTYNFSQMQDVSINCIRCKNCPTTIKQGMDISIEEHNQVDVSRQNDIKNTLKEMITNKALNITKQENKGLPILQTNVNVVENVLNTKLTNETMNYITNKVISTVNEALQTDQNQRVNIYFEDVDCADQYGNSGIYIGQQMSISKITRDILADKTIQNIVNEVSKDIENDYVSETTQKNELNLLEMMLAIFLPIIIIAVIAIVVYFMIQKGVFSKLFGSKKKSAFSRRKKRY